MSVQNGERDALLEQGLEPGLEPEQVLQGQDPQYSCEDPRVESGEDMIAKKKKRCCIIGISVAGVAVLAGLIALAVVLATKKKDDVSGVDENGNGNQNGECRVRGYFKMTPEAQADAAKTAQDKACREKTFDDCLFQKDAHGDPFCGAQNGNGDNGVDNLENMGGPVGPSEVPSQTGDLPPHVPSGPVVPPGEKLTCAKWNAQRPSESLDCFWFESKKTHLFDAAKICASDKICTLQDCCVPEDAPGAPKPPKNVDDDETDDDDEEEEEEEDVKPEDIPEDPAPGAADKDVVKIADLREAKCFKAGAVCQGDATFNSEVKKWLKAPSRKFHELKELATPNHFEYLPYQRSVIELFGERYTPRLLVNHATGTGKSAVIVGLLDRSFKWQQPTLLILKDEGQKRNILKSLVKIPSRWRDFWAAELVSRGDPDEIEWLARLLSKLPNQVAGGDWATKRLENWNVNAAGLNLNDVEESMARALKWRYLGDDKKERSYISKGKLNKLGRTRWEDARIVDHAEIPAGPVHMVKWGEAGGKLTETGRRNNQNRILEFARADTFRTLGNVFTDSLVIMDEVHNLVLPPTPPTAHDANVRNLKDKFTDVGAKAATSFQLVGVTATVPGDPQTILNAIKGGENVRKLNEGFLSYYDGNYKKPRVLIGRRDETLVVGGKNLAILTDVPMSHVAAARYCLKDQEVHAKDAKSRSGTLPQYTSLPFQPGYLSRLKPDDATTFRLRMAEKIEKYLPKFHAVLEELKKDDMKTLVLLRDRHVREFGLLIKNRIEIGDTALKHSLPRLPSQLTQSRSICSGEVYSDDPTCWKHNQSQTKCEGAKGSFDVQDPLNPGYSKKQDCAYEKASAGQGDQNTHYKTFNSDGNMRGDLQRLMIASYEVASEGKDFLHVRKVIMLDVPDVWGTLKQRLGRAVRVGSHDGLPADERDVTIKILSSSYDPAIKNTPADRTLFSALAKQQEKENKGLQILGKPAPVQNIDVPWQKWENVVEAFDKLKAAPDVAADPDITAAADDGAAKAALNVKFKPQAKAKAGALYDVFKGTAGSKFFAPAAPVLTENTIDEVHAEEVVAAGEDEEKKLTAWRKTGAWDHSDKFYEF